MRPGRDGSSEVRAVQERVKAVPVCDGRPVTAVDRSEAAKAAVERPSRDTKRAAAT